MYSGIWSWKGTKSQPWTPKMAVAVPWWCPDWNSVIQALYYYVAWDQPSPLHHLKGHLLPDPVRVCTFPLTPGSLGIFCGMKINPISHHSASRVILDAPPHSPCRLPYKTKRGSFSAWHRLVWAILWEEIFKVREFSVSAPRGGYPVCSTQVLPGPCGYWALEWATAVIQAVMDCGSNMHTWKTYCNKSEIIP
jgi:hypothetical protein